MRTREPVDAAPSPVAQLEQKEMGEVIRNALSRLPETQRIAVLLAKYENMPMEEIAGVLNTSTGAVKQLLYRAKTTLRETLSPFLR